MSLQTKPPADQISEAVAVLSACFACRAGAGNWTGVNGDNSTGDGWDLSLSEEPFYVSGENSQFTVINGVYEPIIKMTVRPSLIFLACATLAQSREVIRSRSHPVINGMKQDNKVSQCGESAQVLIHALNQNPRILCAKSLEAYCACPRSHLMLDGE